jgi:GDP-L-fucose synthase
MKKHDKIYVAGHSGLVGSAILRLLKRKDYRNIITVSSKKLNLIDQKKTFNFLKKKKPKFIFLAAAKVGGIKDNNTYKADFIYQNLSIQNNIIHGAYLAGIKNIIFLGSSCVYPGNCKQPIKEEYLLTGSLEKTNEPYALAKISGIKLCESYNFQYKTNYKCIMPCNTYGPNDNYHPEKSHFLPALIKKIHNIKLGKEKTLKLWGTGNPRREFIYVDDLAEACIHFMSRDIGPNSWINIGTGKDYKIKEIAKIVMNILNVRARIIFDQSKLDGTIRKVLNTKSAKKKGWIPKHSLKQGIIKTYKDFLKNKKNW